MSSVCEGKQSEVGILVLEFVSEMSPQAPVLLVLVSHLVVLFRAGVKS